MKMPAKVRRPLLVLAAALLTLGCSRGGPQIVPIEGTITHKGQPVPNVRIYFVPDGRPSWAISDAEGRFKMNYDAEHDGAKVGTHKVWIIDESGNVDPTLAMSGGPLPKRNPEIRALAEKYGQKNSTLKIEVTKADRHFKLELE